MPKNGNNRPLSLPVGKLSPPSFSAAPSFLDYVIGGAATEAEAVKGGLVSGEAPPEVHTWLVPDLRSSMRTQVPVSDLRSSAGSGEQLGRFLPHFLPAAEMSGHALVWRWRRRG